MRPDGKYTRLEAKLLDLCLVLHAEHGGGNNSAFTVHVVSSSGTDTYSTVAAALGSLKGPKHGGANDQGHGDVRRLEAALPRLGGRGRSAGISQGAAPRRGLRPQRSDLWHGSCGVLRIRPRAVILKSFVEQLSDEKAATLSTSCTPPWNALPRKLSPRTGRSIGVCANVGLLQRLCIPHAGTAYGFVHADLRHCPHCRLVGTPAGRTHQLPEKLSVRHISLWRSRRNMCRWKNDKRKSLESS